jgi:hypothetical protein
MQAPAGLLRALTQARNPATTKISASGESAFAPNSGATVIKLLRVDARTDEKFVIGFMRGGGAFDASDRKS